MNTSIVTDFAAIAAGMTPVSLPDRDDAELIQRYRPIRSASRSARDIIRDQ
jgi:hypothetical protein